MFHNIVNILEIFSTIDKEFNVERLRIHFKDILETVRNFTDGSTIDVGRRPDQTLRTVLYIVTYCASRAYSYYYQYVLDTVVKCCASRAYRLTRLIEHRDIRREVPSVIHSLFLLYFATSRLL